MSNDKFGRKPFYGTLRGTTEATKVGTKASGMGAQIGTLAGRLVMTVELNDNGDFEYLVREGIHEGRGHEKEIARGTIGKDD